jgi:hypothetical protein
MTTRKMGRPKGSNHAIPAGSITQLEQQTNRTLESIKEHREQGGEVLQIEGREFAVVSSAENDPMLALEPPKRAGRPTKTESDFNQTNIGTKRKEVLDNIPSVIIKALRQQSKLERDKHFWLDNGLGYYCNGTLFNRFSMPIQSQENMDIKLSAILQGLVVYLHNNSSCYLVETYLSEIGVPLKWLEKAMLSSPEVSEAYDLAQQICQSRLVKLGFQEGKSAMAKFLLQAKHGYTERKSVETTNYNISGGTEQLRTIIAENDGKNLMKALDKQLKSK